MDIARAGSRLLGYYCAGAGTGGAGGAGVDISPGVHTFSGVGEAMTEEPLVANVSSASLSAHSGNLRGFVFLKRSVAILRTINWHMLRRCESRGKARCSC